MSPREPADNPTAEGAGQTPPRRDRDADVDHVRLAQLVAANYTPPAPTLPPTELAARRSALLSSENDALVREPPARLAAAPDSAPARAAQRFDSARVTAAPPPPPAYSAAPQSYLPLAASAVRPKSSLSCVWLALLALLLLTGGGAFLGWRMWSRSASPSQANTNAPPANVSSIKPLPSSLPSQVFVPGGTFRMGRDDVGEALRNEYPAHAVTLTKFFIDRTEVTNAEYAEFVRETGHPAPSAGGQGEQETPYWKPWTGGSPPAGQEQWPVRNVTAADARAFAAWRSKRDGVAYRLPSEEEWEYAARSGGAFRLYPWGDEFLDDRANVDAALPQPTGSHPRGASREGALDLIGNVWEWTSSDASIYPGNRDLAAPDKGMKVARGGSYQSRARGGAAVTATTRTFIHPETKHPTLGFRLMRGGS